PADLPQDRGEEEHEALDAHPDGLRRREVPELVQDDERGEAGEGEDVAHRASSVATSPKGTLRADGDQLRRDGSRLAVRLVERLEVADGSVRLVSGRLLDYS